MAKTSVLVTGPVSNGTSITYRIVATARKVKAYHCAMPSGGSETAPDGGDWWHAKGNAIQHHPNWEGGHLSGSFDKVIVVLRDIDAAVASTVHRQHAPDTEKAMEKQLRARRSLLENDPFRDYIVITYEELINETDKVLQTISDYIGAKVRLPEPLYDANQQWMTDDEHQEDDAGQGESREGTLSDGDGSDQEGTPEGGAEQEDPIP